MSHKRGFRLIILISIFGFEANSGQMPVIETEAKSLDQSGSKQAKNIGSNEFAEFIYKSVVPACFLAPIRHNDDTQLVNECIACLKAVQSTRGTPELSTFLSNQFFAQHFPNYPNSSELVEALVGSDLKTTKRALKLFCQQFKQNEIT